MDEITSLFDLNETIARDIFTGKSHPWEALPEITAFILALAERLPEDYERIGDDIWAGKGARIAPSASITGPAILGRGCEIRHCAFIRGSVILGDGAIVGNSTELKNAILFNGVQVPHFNYVGDSILGHKAHLGAGVILSNVRSDGAAVRTKLPDGATVTTGLRKFGAMVGDHAEVGCNSVINPGTVLGRGCTVYPLTMARGYVPAGTILKNTGELVERKPKP